MPSARTWSSRAGPSSKATERRTTGLFGDERLLQERPPLDERAARSDPRRRARGCRTGRRQASRPRAGAARTWRGRRDRARTPRRRGRSRRSASAPGRARATSANRSVRSLPFRLWRVASPARTVAMARKPSSFTSCSQPLPGRRRVGERARASASGRGRRPPRCRPCAQEPVLRVAVHVRRDERPEAVQARAVELHGEPAVALSLDELVGARCPRSRRCPPPYSPAGISPSNVAYSSGWSSTCTASRRSPLRIGTPFGTAQLRSTPFSSRRRS